MWAASRCSAALLLIAVAATAAAREPPGLNEALQNLSRGNKFSGAVVIRGPEGVRFAHGYGAADPFTGRPFEPDTPVDSGSLAKPVTAAAILMLAHDGKVDVDAPVQRYLAEYPQPETTVRHLLAHSAGLDGSAVRTIIDRTNAELLAEFSRPGVKPLFTPGTDFNYCNFCFSTLALMIERVSGNHYLAFARKEVALPTDVTIRPRRLSDWRGRAIGYRWTDGKPERADSYEGEAFYGTANLSVSASQLARWGDEWLGNDLATIREVATTSAMIDGKTSGLSWGNWYCAPSARRCHYLGHHEGFHHMLYWNRDLRISVAMVSNNTLAPALQQRLRRAIVAFAEGREQSARKELSQPLSDEAVVPGTYRLPVGDVAIATNGKDVTAIHRGLHYPAYLIGDGIRYIPGLDVYIARGAGGRLHWLSLYDDFRSLP